MSNSESKSPKKASPKKASPKKLTRNEKIDDLIKEIMEAKDKNGEGLSEAFKQVMIWQLKMRNDQMINKLHAELSDTKAEGKKKRKKNKRTKRRKGKKRKRTRKRR